MPGRSAEPARATATVEDEIDVDEDGKVFTEAARGILEKIYGETLDDDTSAVAQQWRKVELESSKIDFEGFLKCYYLKEDPPPAAFSSELDDATAVFGKGRCPGPWWFEWGFFWAFGFPLPFVAAWCVNLYAEGAEGQNPEGYAGSVYEWEPHAVIKTALVGSMFPLTSTLVCALIRGHVPPFGRQGKIINGQRQGGLCACCNWYAEDNTVRQQKEDIGQMSGVLGLLFGPFLVITVIGSCLYLVVWGLLQSPDGSGYISRDYDASQYLNASKYPAGGRLPDNDVTRHMEWACTSPLGYFGTISGVSANILPQGYVFMFIALSSNAMIILYNMPPIGILGSLTEEPTESVSKRQWEHGFFPNKDLIWCCMLIRVGLGMTVITGVLPDLAKGVTPLASVGLLSLTKLHLGGITLGIGLVLIGITWYVVEALHLRTTNDNHAKHLDKPLLWVPHVATMWTLVLTFLMVLAFLESNGNQPPYDNYYNVCLLRSPRVFASSASCQFPTESFNVSTYQTHYREYYEEEFEPKHCSPNSDGTLCINRGCHYRYYSVGFAFEFALLYLAMILCQMFVYMFHFDWQIHDPLIITEKAADAPTSGSLQNRDEVAPLLNAGGGTAPRARPKGATQQNPMLGDGED